MCLRNATTSYEVQFEQSAHTLYLQKLFRRLGHMPIASQTFVSHSKKRRAIDTIRGLTRNNKLRRVSESQAILEDGHSRTVGKTDRLCKCCLIKTMNQLQLTQLATLLSGIST